MALGSHLMDKLILLTVTHDKTMMDVTAARGNGKPFSTLGNFCFNSGQPCSGPCEAWFLTMTNSRGRREARRTTADYNGIEEA